MKAIDAAPAVFLLLCGAVFIVLAGEDVVTALWDRSSERDPSTVGSSTPAMKTRLMPKITTNLQEPALRVREHNAALKPSSLSALAPWGEVRLQTTKHKFAIKFSRAEIYNPALALQPDGFWLYARFEGRNATGSWAACPVESLETTRDCPVQDLRMVSFVVRCKLDATWACSSELETLPYKLDWARVMTSLHERELGPEDPRVQHMPDGRIILFYNAPPVRDLSVKKTIRSMKAQQVYPAVVDPVDLDLLNRLERIEKNWSPISAIDSDLVLMSRSLNPHEVIQCSITSGQCESLETTEAHFFFDRLLQIWECRALHLGTNAVLSPRNDSYLAIFHGLPSAGQKRYFNFVYEFEAKRPWRVMAVARDPLELPLGTVGHGFVFTSSLMRVGDDYVVGYNVNDRSAAYAVLNATALMSSLAAVSRPAMP